MYRRPVPCTLRSVKHLIASQPQPDILVAGPLLFSRRGPRPNMPAGLPHVQADQWPPAGLARRLLGHAAMMPNVQIRQSRMASPATSALSLVEGCAHGPWEAFIDGTEFCHVLPSPQSTIHLTLPAPLRIFAIERGWAEEHPVARMGALSPGLVTLYAPRDDHEFDVVLRLIESSWKFASGFARAEGLNG